MAPGLGLGLGLAAGRGRGALTGLGGCLAAVFGFRWVASAGLVGAWALAVAGLLAVGTGFWGPVWEVSPAAWGVECWMRTWWWWWMRWSGGGGCGVGGEGEGGGRRRRALGFGGGRRMLGPASSENEGAGSGTRPVRALSLVTRVCWCWCGGVVSAVRACGLPGGWPYLLQDVWVCLLEVVEGAEEASLDAGHVLLCEVGVVLGGGVWARTQQRHEAGSHHVWAEL